MVVWDRKKKGGVGALGADFVFFLFVPAARRHRTRRSFLLSGLDGRGGGVGSQRGELWLSRGEEELTKRKAQHRGRRVLLEEGKFYQRKQKWKVQSPKETQTTRPCSKI